MTIMRFTPLEREILLHRLSEHDCIADAIDNGEPHPYRHRVIETAARLENEVRHGVAQITTPLDHLVLADTLEGSTYTANLADAVASGEVTARKASSIRQAVRNLERKLSAALGKNIKAP